MQWNSFISMIKKFFLAVKYNVHVNMIYKRYSFVGFIIPVSRYLNTAKCQNIANFKFFYVRKFIFVFLSFFFEKVTITISNNKNMWTKHVTK